VMKRIAAGNHLSVQTKGLRLASPAIAT
jgi:hypothetical protein